MLDRADRVFFDSNILLYLATSDGEKAARVEELLGLGGAISVQVLNEIASVARRKMQMSWDEIADFTTSIRGLFEVIPLTIEIHEHGLHLARRHKLAIYDGLIVAAALVADCNVLLSEDMHDGLVLEKRLTVRNPFKTG